MYLGLLHKIKNACKHSISTVCSVSEVDIEDFDEKKPFTIKGCNTYYPLQKTGTNTKRLLCFVKDSIEVKQRNDLMSNLLSNVWMEIKGSNQKILICTKGIYNKLPLIRGFDGLSIIYTSALADF